MRASGALPVRVVWMNPILDMKVGCKTNNSCHLDS